MSVRTKAQGVRAAQDAISSYQDQVDSFNAELHDVLADRRRIDKQIQQAIESLAEGLLPDANAETVQRTAKEMGAPQLCSRQARLVQDKAEAEARIVAIAGEAAFIQADELTHPVNGTYTLKVQEQQSLVNDLQQGLRPYNDKDFQWLYQRGYHKQQQHSGFSRFMRTITFADKREQGAAKRCLAQLDQPDFPSAAMAYDDTQAALSEHKKSLKHWQAEHRAVTDLVAEHASLQDFVSDFPRACTDALRTELAEHLQEADYAVLHGRCRPAGRILLAKCDALVQKDRYLYDLEKYIKNEIHDREERISSIRRVKQKWARKPYGMLRGDKQKWLVDVPHMKYTGTRKRVGWVGTMRSNIVDYEDYGLYESCMRAEAAFLAYDLFAFQSSLRMPYEGFSRTVITDLDDWREEYNMAGPDYGEFRDAAGDVQAEIEDWDASVEDLAALALAAELAEEAEMSLSDDS